MPLRRQPSLVDSDSEFSETDESIYRLGRTSEHLSPARRMSHAHRRSVSRHRYSPDYNHRSYHLSPPVAQEVQVHRSASTGGRRPRRDQDRNQPVAVVVDIKNDSRNKSSNKGTNRSRKQSETNLAHYDSDEDTVTDHLDRRHHHHSHRRPRASSTVSYTREASPRHYSPRQVSPPQQHRDYELLIGQELLKKNDRTQDFELFKQQQDIDRLERELARTRENSRELNLSHHETRLLKEEEDWYEEEISERLRKLETLERKQRMAEEQKDAEHRWKLRKFEEHQKREREEEEVSAKIQEEKLKEIKRKLDEEEEFNRIRKEIADKELRERHEREEKEKKEALMKQAAVEEWKLAQERKKIEEREEKKKQDQMFKDRLKMELGLTDEEVEDFLKKKKEEKDKKDKDEKKDDDKKVAKKEEPQMPWIKVHHRYLLPDTLFAYQLPWDWDDHDSNFIIIKKWISEDFQEELFAHTRRLREGRLVSQHSDTLTELRVNDRRKDKMYLVRKKSPSRRSWIFT